MRYVFAALLILGVLWISWHWFGAATAPVPDNPDELDPLVAELVEDGVNAVNRNRRNGQARLQLGMVYEANGLNDLARQCYEQLAGMRSPDPRVFYRLAMLHESEGDVSTAIEYMKRSIERDDSYAPAHWRLGYWQLDAGHADAAHDAFERAIELEHSNLAAWFGMARVHMLRHELEQAIDLLETRLMPSRESAHAEHLLARALRRAGRSEEADRVAWRVGDEGAQSPRWSDPWSDEVRGLATGYSTLRHRAEFLVSTRRFDEAVDLLERLREETEVDAPLLNMLGVAYITQGRTELGLQTLNEALEYDPRHYPLLINLARGYLHAAGPHGVDRVALTTALAEVQRAIDVNPESGQAYALLGTIQYRRGEYDAAIDALLTAFDLDARNLQPLRDAASIQMQLQRWDDLISTCRRIVRHEPDDGDAHLMMARAWLQLENYDQARTSLEQAQRAGVRSPAEIRTLQEQLSAEAPLNHD